jgi:aspartate racemase
MIDGRRLLGVLDCVEPLLGAAFMERLAAAARRHGGGVPVVLWSDAAPASGGDQPEHAAPASVLLGLHALERLGADAVVMPGAAAHAWYRDLCAAAHVPVMHIVECTATDLRRVKAPGSRVAVLGDPADAGVAIYAAGLARLGFEVVEVPRGMADTMAHAARSIAMGDPDAAGEAVLRCADDLGRAGAGAVVLGSGELACAADRAMAQRRRSGTRGPAVIDPLASMAGVAAAWCRGACDAWDLVASEPDAAPEPAAAPPA